MCEIEVQADTDGSSTLFLGHPGPTIQYEVPIIWSMFLGVLYFEHSITVGIVLESYHCYTQHNEELYKFYTE